MKGKLSILGLGLLLATLLAGCRIADSHVTIRGSGNVVTQEEGLSEFDQVDVSQAFRVNIRQSETFQVVIRVDDNVVEHLDVRKTGDTLRIGLKTNRSYSLREVTLEAEVAMPELTGLELSGASRATIRGFTLSKALAVDLSGASDLRGDLKARQARFDVSGSSQLTLNGSATDVTVDASGASIVNLEDFSAGDADVKASGASSVTVNASGVLNGEASGASRIYYLGNPELERQEVSGVSAIQGK